MRKYKSVNVCLAVVCGTGVGITAVAAVCLAMVLGSGMGTTAMALNCTTNIPAQCHYASTNIIPMPFPLPNWWEITSDGFSTQCVGTNSTYGGLVCNSITNKCIYQIWVRKSDGTDLPKSNKTNDFVTTVQAGDCTGG
jgi:hypothetical protein